MEVISIKNYLEENYYRNFNVNIVGLDGANFFFTIYSGYGPHLMIQMPIENHCVFVKLFISLLN